MRRMPFVDVAKSESIVLQSAKALCLLSRNGRVPLAANAPAHLQIDLQISGQQNRQVDLDKKG